MYSCTLVDFFFFPLLFLDLLLSLESLTSLPIESGFLDIKIIMNDIAI